MQTLDAILSRTSYRGKYDPTPVPREHLQLLLEAGLAAPSGCNKQTTSLIAVNDPDILRQLNALTESKIGQTAPAMILVLTRRIIAYRDRTYFVQDYSAAIENILLAAVSLGYESCWVEGQVTDEDNIGRKMADVLGVPEEYELICYLPIGKAADATRSPKKEPFSERAWFNGFKK
ncbi:MAG: nitroreductase [Firmicutes bacterium HGW-Firmicutes-9]|jgi:nitroreductase|nr:MAG: nitroreductase [Firmicutes bacterium HGW-Firmicutes-9]